MNCSSSRRAWAIATAATRVGVGLVTLALGESIFPIVAGKLLEPTYILLPESMGVISPDAIKVLDTQLTQYQALLIGPGLGQDKELTRFVQQLLASAGKASAKAAAVADHHPGEVVLAADTIVVLDGVILGKPRDPLDAVAMLSALRDRVHVVYTAVCVIYDGRATTRLSATDVTMRAYTDAEIEAYVETGDPLDKAGAYGIQDPRFAPVAAWDGCYSAVMGLPLGLAAELLAEAGVGVSEEVSAACRSITGDRCCLGDE